MINGMKDFVSPHKTSKGERVTSDARIATS